MNIYESGEYLRLNPTWHEEDAPLKLAQVMQLIRRNRLEPASVVEVGTGSGEVLRLLSREIAQARMTGFDISADAIRLASPKAGGLLEFRRGSPFEEPAGYDLALALDVFEHVEDYLGFLRNMPRVASYQIYNIPLDLSVRYVLQKSLIMHARESVGHLHYFFKDTALASLEHTGHRVVDYIYHSRSLVRRDLRGAFRRWLFRLNPDLCVRLMGGFSLAVLCTRSDGH